MAFFNDLGKAVSKAGQATLQKTKDFSETTRLNGLISDEEKKLDSVYFQIGKLYVSLHREDPETQFAAMLQAVTESEERIQSLKKEVEIIKGVSRCPACGAEVARGSAFCSSCGEPMPKEEIENMIVCQVCGTRVKRGMSFCTACGNPLNTPETKVSFNMQSESTPTPEIKKCPYCGTEVQDGLLFCANCGERL